MLALDPHTGAIFCFRGHRGHVIKILAHDDPGLPMVVLPGQPPEQVALWLT